MAARERGRRVPYQVITIARRAIRRRLIWLSVIALVDPGWNVQHFPCHSRHEASQPWVTAMQSHSARTKTLARIACQRHDGQAFFKYTLAAVP